MQYKLNKYILTSISSSKTIYNLLIRGRIIFRNIFQIDHEKDIELITNLLVQDVKVALDVGANRGDFTQSLLWRNCEVISFEPDQSSYDTLRKRFGKNPKVHLHNFGCGSSNCKKTLYTPCYNKYQISGMSSTKKELVIDIIEKLKILKPFIFFSKDKLHIKSKVIEIRTLDSFQLSPDFIKIDTEGSEFEVIKGAGNTIKKHLPIIYIEGTNEALLQYLFDLGYHIFAQGKNNTVLKNKEG